MRRFNKRWLANCAAKKEERKAVADPNIEREYFQERNFRFGMTFTRSRIYESIPLQTVAQMSNPKWKVVLRGRLLREETWKDLEKPIRLRRKQ